MSYYFNEIEHLHILNHRPLTGTSTIVGVLSKPLTYWASGKACEVFGWTPTKTDKQERLKAAKEVLEVVYTLTPDKYLAMLDKAYKNHKTSLDKSADKGIDLHAELESYIKDCMAGEPQTYDQRIVPFINWATENVKKWLWSEAHCYSEKLWVGGICDAGAIMNDDSVALIDFKSSKAVYTSHWLQCGGYALEIEENGLFDKDGKRIWNDYDPIHIDKLIVVPFGAEVVIPVENKVNIKLYKEGFKNAVGLYRLIGLEETLNEGR